jgi:hypothetical protein
MVSETRTENHGRFIYWWHHFLSQTPPSRQNRNSAIIANQKSWYNFQVVHARQALCIEL